MSNHVNEMIMEGFLCEASDLSTPQLLSALSDFRREQLMKDIKEVSSIVRQREMLETAFVFTKMEQM